MYSPPSILSSLRAGEGGALGGLLLIEAGELAGAVEVVREAGQGLEGERGLGARARGHREPFGVSAGAGLDRRLVGAARALGRPARPPPTTPARRSRSRAATPGRRRDRRAARRGCRRSAARCRRAACARRAPAGSTSVRWIEARKPSSSWETSAPSRQRARFSPKRTFISGVGGAEVGARASRHVPRAERVARCSGGGPGWIRLATIAPRQLARPSSSEQRSLSCPATSTGAPFLSSSTWRPPTSPGTSTS